MEWSYCPFSELVTDIQMEELFSFSKIIVERVLYGSTAIERTAFIIHLSVFEWILGFCLFV